ncbi:DUF2232 domain-containing protein [Bdellovibrionota bacterium FG-2]
MFRWATNPDSPRGAVPRWIQGVPFVLSALFFLSAFFSLFAPLPILFVFFRSGRKWAWGVALVNASLVALLAGWVSFFLYIIFVLTLAMAMAECLSRKLSIEKAVGGSLLALLIVAVLAVGAYSGLHHVKPWVEIQHQASVLVELVTDSIMKGGAGDSALLGVGDKEEWKASLLVEFPSALAVFSLILAWINLVALLRFNPGGLRESLGITPDFFKRWKAPEFLIWPTIVCGALLLLKLGWFSDVAINVFKFLMAIYALHGLSILSFLLDIWSVKGPLRALAVAVAVFLMMPLLLSLGFFDLWFDFRGKFRQS